MVIDCHCHAGLGDLLKAPWNTAAPLGAQLRRSRAAGIDKTVVFPLFHSDYNEGNRQVARLAAKRPDRLIGFGFVHPRTNEGRVREMVAQCVRWGFRGMKVHGHDASPTREVCEAMRAFKMPLLVDVAGRAHLVDMFAPEFPDVNFIIPHLGSFADDFRAHQQVIDQLTRYPNVYTDTSGVRRFDYLLQAVRRAGPRKVLFGSDGPWLHPGLELHKIRLLGLSPHDEALVVGGNIIRLMRPLAASAEPFPSVAAGLCPS